LQKGTTDITVTFNDAAFTSTTIQITVNPVVPVWPAGSTLAVSDVTYKGVVLTWTAAQDVTAVTGYRIYKDGIFLDTVAGDVTTYSVTGLSQSQNYTFQVQAGNADDQWTSDGPIVTATTKAYPSNSSGSSSTDITIRYGKNPDDPFIAVINITPVADSKGNMVVAISGAHIAEAVFKAQLYANAQGKTANGIGVAVNVVMKEANNGVSVRFSREALQRLVDAGVKELQIGNMMLSINLDLKVLREILSQSAGEVTITISPVQNLPDEAEKIIGTRPAYEIDISFVKDEKNVNITELGEGIAVISIPYAYSEDEAVNYLYGVYVDDDGKAHPIEDSYYDVENGCLVMTTNHFSIYGVGYTAPSDRFTDIQNHWALKSIDFVVGRGLISGTSETVFSPNTPMPRGLLVMALGKLAGVNEESYKNMTFTDVDGNSVYAPYVEWAYRIGIVKGIGNNMFDPERYITREEIAIIFANYAKTMGYTLPVIYEATPYADQELIGNSYREAVKVMRQAGIMVGGTDNRFNPKGNVTRAEVSAMIYRYIKLTTGPETVQK